MSLRQFLSADGATAGSQAASLLFQFAAKLPPEQLERLAGELGVPEPAESVRRTLRAYQRAARVGAERKHLAAQARVLSPQLIEQCAQHLGVRASGRSFTAHWGDDVMTIATPRQLVAGRFVAGSLSLIVGASGVSKTFLGVSLALSLATGAREWLGARILGTDHRVLYAIPEGYGMFKFRVLAWMQRAAARGIVESAETPASFGVSRDPIRLLDDESVDAFIETFGAQSPNVVIIDTWQRHSGPEQDEREMRKAIENVDRIRFDLNATTIIMHHTPKDGRMTPRGHGSIDASADTVVLLKATDDRRSIIEATFEQRDLDEQKLTYQREIVQLDNAATDEGEPITSCVIELADPKAAAPRASKRKADNLSDKIRNYVDVHHGCSRKEVADAVKGSRRQAILEEISTLVEGGLLREEREAQGSVTLTRLYPAESTF
jgi:RecA-family ATPase